MTAPHITCVYGSAEGEYVIKKSRFLVHLKEVRREDEATAYIEALKNSIGMQIIIVPPIASATTA